MLVYVEVDIVTPLSPPGGTDQKLAIPKTSEISLQHKWVLDLGQRHTLIALEGVFHSLPEVLKEKLLDDFLLLAARQVLAEVTANLLRAAHVEFMVLWEVIIAWRTLALAAFFRQNLLGCLMLHCGRALSLRSVPNLSNRWQSFLDRLKVEGLVFVGAGGVLS